MKPVVALVVGAAGLVWWCTTAGQAAGFVEPWWRRLPLSRRDLLYTAARVLPAPLDEWVLEDLAYDDISFGYGQCPYLHGGGACIGGCWEEPACVTSQPADGWPNQPPGLRDVVAMAWRAARNNRDLLAEEWAWAPRSWAR